MPSIGPARVVADELHDRGGIGNPRGGASVKTTIKGMGSLAQYNVKVWLKIPILY